jgi:predicted nicotinamide N-methyase
MRALLGPVTLVPEVRLHLYDPSVGLWDATGGEYRSDRPPPFWAFAWPGGQALARHLLDHPELVAGRRVLDVACGSGLVAIAAARAGARTVQAIDIDPAAITATRRNARANAVTVAARVADVRSYRHTEADLVVAGDACYSDASAPGVLALLRRARRGGAAVLIGDAGRGFLPAVGLRRLASYDVPVALAVEGVPVLPATVWTTADP